MSRHSDRSWAYRVKRKSFLRDHTVCWQCGHEGANQVDHVTPRSKDQDRSVDTTNWQPSHGPPGCPVCGRNCNQKRGNRAPRPYVTTPSSYPTRSW